MNMNRRRSRHRLPFHRPRHGGAVDVGEVDFVEPVGQRRQVDVVAIAGAQHAQAAARRQAGRSEQRVQFRRCEAYQSHCRRVERFSFA